MEGENPTTDPARLRAQSEGEPADDGGGDDDDDDDDGDDCDDGDDGDEDGDEEAVWTPPVRAVARRRPSTGPADGFHSRGQAQIAAMIPPGYGGQLARRGSARTATTGTTPPPPPPPAVDTSGVSPALVGFAVLVVVATLAGLGFTLLGQDDDGRALSAADAAAPTLPPPTKPGRDVAPLWKLDGYDVFAADANALAEMRKDMDSIPFGKEFFRAVNAREVWRNGRPVAAVIVLTFDPDAAAEPSFAAEMWEGIKSDTKSFTETTVSGVPSMWDNDGTQPALVSLKQDVMVVVVADTRSAAVPVMTKVLANIT